MGRHKAEWVKGLAGSKFDLGQVSATPGAMEALTAEEILSALKRHASGDWGEVGPEDWQENDSSLQRGFRFFSVYHTKPKHERPRGIRFWVITEADRSITTVLLPEEY